MMAEPLAELVDVEKTYARGVTAVTGASLALAPGEFVSLLGPSGCGKSTVLRIIAGLSRPTRGVVRRAWDDGARSRDTPVGCVFQDPTLLPWSTVWSNVYLPLRIAGASRREAAPRVDEALHLVGLAEFAHARPGQLSGGMRMRASLARAIVTRPRLLLLDEPLAALDEITRNRLNDELRALWRLHGWTALFITHSVFESVYLSTRVLVMSNRPGRIVEEIAIDLPAERDAATRTSPKYIELCRQTSAALERAMHSHDSSGPLPLEGRDGEGGRRTDG
jgi:NitT/TauT family transport system ATP-binding protein